MSNAINKPKNDQQRLARISKAYDCIPPNIPTKVVFPGGWEIPRCLDIDEIQSFEIEHNDIFIVTQPKCGTTWMQELTWLISNNLDLEGAKCNQFFRVPFLEIQGLRRGKYLIPKDKTLSNKELDELNNYPEGQALSEETVNWYMLHSVEFSRRLKRPRIIKSHLPLSLLPADLVNKCKVIYVARNIKDATVSYFHHKKITSGCKEFKAFAKCSLNHETEFGPFIPHILEAWKQRKHPNLFFTTFEDMKTDLRKVATDLLKFLKGNDATIDMDTLLAQLDIETFRKNKFVNKEQEIPPDKDGNTFIRKGIVGDWKNHFDVEMNAEWDPWIEKQLSGSGFKMVFEQ
jgi:hypothetical protein